MAVNAHDTRILRDLAARVSVVGHLFHDQLRTEADLKKIRIPSLRMDAEGTAARAAEAREIFDGILDVREESGSPMFNVWDAIVTWRGAENVLIDLGERPEFMHKLLARDPWTRRPWRRTCGARSRAARGTAARWN